MRNAIKQEIILDYNSGREYLVGVPPETNFVVRTTMAQASSPPPTFILVYHLKEISDDGKYKYVFIGARA